MLLPSSSDEGHDAGGLEVGMLLLEVGVLLLDELGVGVGLLGALLLVVQLVVEVLQGPQCVGATIVLDLGDCLFDECYDRSVSGCHLSFHISTKKNFGSDADFNPIDFLSIKLYLFEYIRV